MNIYGQPTGEDSLLSRGEAARHARAVEVLTRRVLETAQQGGSFVHSEVVHPSWHPSRIFVNLHSWSVYEEVAQSVADEDITFAVRRVSTRDHIINPFTGSKLGSIDGERDHLFITSIGGQAIQGPEYPPRREGYVVYQAN